MVLAALVGLGCQAPDETAKSTDDPTFVEELRIGVAEGADPYMIGQVHLMAVAADGTIYAADRQLNVVRAYNRAGEYLGDVGRAGEGPGEYRQINGLAVLPDGRLALLDAFQTRVILYSPDGSEVAGFRTRESVWAGRQDLDLAGDGHILVRTIARPEGGVRERDWRRGYDVHDLDGTVVDTIMEPEPSGFVRSDAPFVVNALPMPLEPFTVRGVQAWSPDGHHLVAMNDAYEIEAVTPDGSRTVAISRAIAPAPLVGGERAQWEAITSFVDERMTDPDFPLEHDGYSGTKPFFRAIDVGRNGRVWVWRYVEALDGPPLPDLSGSGRPPLTWREPPTFDGFEPTGEYIGTVVLPRSFVPLLWRDDHVWGADEDAAGVRFIVRLRLAPKPRAN
jgi:hypothetical protein